VSQAPRVVPLVRVALLNFDRPSYCQFKLTLMIL